MKFLVIQKRHSPGKYVEVARVARPADAILFAAALVKASTPQGPVQVYRLFRRQYAYCLLAESPGFPGLDARIKLALETHQTKEKDWRSQQREQKAKRNAVAALLARFGADHRSPLLKDKAFCAAAFATPIQEEAALTRAAEVGIFPESSIEKAVGV